MKKKAYQLAFLLFFLTGYVSAQTGDSLLLEIKSLNKTGPVLRYFGAKTVVFNDDPVTLAIKSSEWPFIIRSNTTNAYVLISQNGGDTGTTKLTGINTRYLIRKDSLIGTQFILKSGMQIKVFNKTTNSLIKTFTLVLSNADDAGQKNGGENISDTSKMLVGSPVNDALNLAGNANIVMKTKILEHYAGGSGIDKAFKNNKFLDSLAANVSGPKAFSSFSLSSIFSSIGGLDVTNIADGFAKFIVKRAKQELSIAFFEKFKKEIEKYPDLKTVFPNTYNLLAAIDQQIYNYSNYINNLREAFRSDLKAVDDNLPGIIDNHPAFFEKKHNFELAIALRTGCYVSSSLKHEMHPGDILDGYPVSIITEKAPVEDLPRLKMLKGAIQSLQLLSETLRENDTSKHSYWVGIDKISQLVNNKTAFKIYIGLMLEIAKNKYDSIKFKDAINLYNELNKQEVEDAFDKDYDTYTAFKQYILNFGSKLSELNKMVKDYEAPGNDSMKVEQYARYFKTTVQFIQYCVQVTKLPYIKKINGLQNLGTATEKYFDIAYETADLASAIIRRRYPEVVNHLVVIYNDMVTEPAQATAQPDPTREQKIALADKIVAQNAANPNTTTASVISSFPDINTTGESGKVKLTTEQKIALADSVISQNAVNPNATTASVIATLPAIINVIKDIHVDAPNAKNVLADLVKYGSFMSNMIYAKTSDEVEAAIESVALPVGSSRIKRNTAFNVAVNAYAGLFYGHESIRGIKDHLVFNSYGLTAPIGISASIGTKRGWSHSLFISIVDIGAIAAFRFSNDTTAQVPTIQLKNIISPGLFYSLGIPRTPISLNIGAQVGPNLRKVTSTVNDYSDKTYLRYSFAVCVDLPLLNLYTKSK